MHTYTHIGGTLLVRATHCNTLQHTATHSYTHTQTHTHRWHPTCSRMASTSKTPVPRTAKHTATHCNTLQHIATHGNTWQHILTYTRKHTRTGGTLHVRAWQANPRPPSLAPHGRYARCRAPCRIQGSGSRSNTSRHRRAAAAHHAGM